jgi:hypothetical protein
MCCSHDNLKVKLCRRRDKTMPDVSKEIREIADEIEKRLRMGDPFLRAVFAEGTGIRDVF